MFKTHTNTHTASKSIVFILFAVRAKELKTRFCNLYFQNDSHKFMLKRVFPVTVLAAKMFLYSTESNFPAPDGCNQEDGRDGGDAESRASREGFDEDDRDDSSSIGGR